MAQGTYRVITSTSALDRDKCGVIWHKGNFPGSFYTVWILENGIYCPSSARVNHIGLKTKELIKYGFSNTLVNCIRS